jgi:hypothetical protein
MSHRPLASELESERKRGNPHTIGWTHDTCLASTDVLFILLSLDTFSPLVRAAKRDEFETV